MAYLNYNSIRLHHKFFARLSNKTNQVTNADFVCVVRYVCMHVCMNKKEMELCHHMNFAGYSRTCLTASGFL